MIRSQSRSLSLSASVAATLLCVAAPAFAQDPNTPPPAGSIPPPIQAMSAPKVGDDMTGSLGFGVGVIAGTSLVSPTASIALKYWLSDVLAVVPALNFQVLKLSSPPGGGPTPNTQWDFAPEAVVLFVPFRSTTTRLSLGGGLGIDIGKGPGATTTAVHIYVPIQAGVEHFFTRWFSIGIAARSNLIDYNKDVAFSTSITTRSNNLGVVGQLFFYTD
jgi:hypothetical protein